MKFKFSINSDLKNGGYLLLQQANTKENSQKMNFISSTCDFSDNDIYTDKAILTNRPKCISLYNDFNYTGVSSINEYAGSGIFFKMDEILPSKSYYVTVWVMAENCWGIDPTNDKTSNIQFSFDLKVFKSLDQLKENENRLFYTGNSILAKADKIKMDNKCYGTKLFKKGENYANATANAAGGSDELLYLELTDLNIIDASAKTCPNTNCYTNDISVTANKVSMYYYSSSNVSNTNKLFSYPLIEASFKTYASHTLMSSFPFPIQKGATFLPQPGKLRVLYSKALFKDGAFLTEGKCEVSWGFVVATQAPTQKKLTHTAGGYPAGPVANVLHSSEGIPALDMSKSELPAVGPKSMYKIMSVFEPVSGGAGNNESVFFNMHADKAITCGAGGDCASSFNLYTNCLAWDFSSNTKVKSIFFHMDIFYQFLYMKDSTKTPAPLRVVRLIKLFNEINVFTDISKTAATTTSYKFNTGSIKPAIFHSQFGRSYTDNTLCILQLSNTMLKEFTNTNNSNNTTFNHLMISLFNINLIDTDYTVLSSIYPSNNANINTYAYNSQFLLSNTNLINSLYQGWAAPKLFKYHHFENTSNYRFFLSSYIYIDNTNNALNTEVSSNSNDILYPIFCPIGKKSIEFTLPVYSISLINIDTQVNSTIRFLQDKDNFYQTLNTQYMNGTDPHKGLPNAVAYVTLRFNTYTGVSRTDELSMFIGRSPGTAASSEAPANAYVSGVVWLAKKDLEIKSTHFQTNILASDKPTYYYKSNQDFYVYGKPFSHIWMTIIAAKISITYGIRVTDIKRYDNTTEQSGFGLISGVVRPSINYFIKTNYSNQIIYDTNNKVAVFTSSLDYSEANKVYTNLVIDTNNLNTVRDFILDYNVSTSDTFVKLNFTSDISEGPFKNDFAGNIKLNYKLPLGVPSGSKIIIRGEANAIFSPNTICGIANTNEVFVDDCTKPNTFKQHECTIKSQSSDITEVNICCYNVKVIENIELSRFDVAFPDNSKEVINLNKYTVTTLYKSNYNADNTLLKYTIPSYADLVSFPEFPTVTHQRYTYVKQIIYDHSNQENALGRISMIVQLARSLLRSSAISLNGDFSNLLIPNIIPRCVVTTNTSIKNNKIEYGTAVNLDKGDVFIEKCDLSNIQNKTDSIVITTKSFIYKCGLTLSREIMISLWPVQQTNFANLTNDLFEINLNLIQTGEAEAYNFFPIKMPIVYYALANKPNYEGQWNNLCLVSNIYPRFAEEVAYYDFEFDLDTTSGSLYNNNPNEFTIFFPFQYYGSDQTQLSCKYLNALKGINVNCTSKTEGILSMRFDSVLPFGNNKRAIIRVFGITNPYLDEEISFGCSINSIDLFNRRNNLVTGSGRLTGGLNLPTNVHNLRLFNTDTSASDLNPRTEGVLTLRIGFDNSVGALSPSLLNNFINIIITLPSEYQLYYYDNLSITAGIDEWVGVDNSAKVKKASSIKVGAVQVFYNSIAIKLVEETRNFF